MSPDQLLHIAQAGGVALSICLLLVALALARGDLEWGSSVRRERGQAQERLEREHEWGEQGWRERDDYKAQVESRQQAVESALAVAQAQLQARRERFEP